MQGYRHRALRDQIRTGRDLQWGERRDRGPRTDELRQQAGARASDSSGTSTFLRSKQPWIPQKPNS